MLPADQPNHRTDIEHHGGGRLRRPGGHLARQLPRPPPRRSLGEARRARRAQRHQRGVSLSLMLQYTVTNVQFKQDATHTHARTRAHPFELS